MNKILIIMGFFFVVSCTDDFNEINEQPDALSTEDVSAKFFVTTVQQQLLRPTMIPLWFGDVIMPDQFSGQSSNGWAGSDWTGDLGWVYNSFYTDLGCWDWLAGYNSTLTSYMNNVDEGGALEDDMYYALGLIIKGFYYQQFTEAFGMIPFSEASDPNITLPKYDEQIDVYKGIIADIDKAIAIIGSNVDAGTGFGILRENDVVFNGNMQNWKKTANSLKLRIALRAHGSQGEDFSANAASEAISSGVLADADALFEGYAEETNIWGGSASYGDIWNNFTGSQWKVSEAMINIMKSSNDPRLSKIALPSVGGSMTIVKPTDGEGVTLISDHIAFVKSTLDKSGLILDTDYTWTETAADLTITMPENTNYIGMPSRLSPKLKGYMPDYLFSNPADIITQKTNQGKPLFPTILMTSADSHFMIAEAIVKGLASGDANNYYQIGLEKAMAIWETSTTSDFLGSNMGSLNGTVEENLEKIATQRWLANYTNGYESWSIVRDTGYPTTAVITSDNNDIYSFAGEMNGLQAQRLRYGTSVYGSNGENVNIAVSKQGPDNMTTKLWFAK
ncbi:SusD/RagB family nutrient-binding outer membrane lipoprotein [Flavobacteriaceae bacterium]|nr:SusD/RagB family nutrient-binding outer membrane lipoprotein [Flavobacteriaceae bacterium]MDA9937143.1 SusD/RagB family nutrient-binding outer membrane lipoprotein [Flavobacteriaceae bacterium]MDB4264284.1 SusD/RagB family nutrient-binding outer membrane lipoprotein [Flavobacteriaceae bacterium]MDC0133480.1 SusD/RagB family nutrient-binding outer membrane lipoprotein [Flavobacteriaceae bacterium]MDC0486797.1 SusD/RagB family nutrient-binding outer membrane lipoprotein [Flavobacteriaceae bact